MLLTNQQLEKLAATRSHFVSVGMLPPSHAPLLVPPHHPPGNNSRGHGRNNNDNDLNDAGPVDDDLVMVDVQLARTQGEYDFFVPH